jgi:predicted RNase H-like HicB family nuclease
MKYGFTAVKKNGYWECKSDTLEGCVAHGDTLILAIFELELIEFEWIKRCKSYELPVPKEGGEA